MSGPHATSRGPTSCRCAGQSTPSVRSGRPGCASACALKEIPVGGTETRAAALEAAERYASCADLLILDTHADREWIGATGRVHDWSISAEIVRSAPIPCILAGGLDPYNLRGALEAVGPWGVDSYSRTNLPSLRKDLDKVRAFVEVARRFDDEKRSRASALTPGAKASERSHRLLGGTRAAGD